MVSGETGWRGTSAQANAERSTTPGARDVGLKVYGGHSRAKAYNDPPAKAKGSCASSHRPYDRPRAGRMSSRRRAGPSARVGRAGRAATAAAPCVPVPGWATLAARSERSSRRVTDDEAHPEHRR